MDIQIIQIVDDYDKYEVDNKIGSYHSHNAHNGNQVSLISLSPSGTYAVTYSEDDNSIEGWIIESEIELDRQTANLTNLSEEIYVSSIKVNDYKIVCHTDSYSVEIFRMSKYQELQEIKLKSPSEVRRPKINFTKLNNLVIFDNERISIYTHGKNSNELSLISSHELSSYNEVILGVFIDDNNIWVISPNYLFHWDLGTLETFQLKSSYSLGFMITNREIDHTFTVISKGNLNVVKNCDKIAIFLKGVHFPIQNIKLEDSDIKIELCEVQNNVYLLAFNSLLKDGKQNITLYHITDINKQPMKDASMIFNKDDSKNKFILSEYNSKSKKAFGLINGKFQYIKSSDLNWHEVFESHKEENDFVGWNNYLCQTNYYNDTLAFPDMDNIKSLISGCNNHKEITFDNQKYKWKIDEENREFSVCSDKNNEYDKKGLDISWNMTWNWKLLNNNALALRYYGNTVGDSIKIYEYDINNKKIEIKYYYKKGFVKLNEKDFSGPLLPIMTIIGDLDTCNLKEIIDSIIKDSRCLAKYGSTLLPILIRSSDPTFTCYIEQIYDECMRLVKEDPKRNLKFLSIITLSMNDLYKKYSNYLTKLNSEMFMILDPFNDKIVNNEKNLHLHSHFYTFSQEIEISKYSKFLKFFQYFYQYLLLSLIIPVIL
ncbi:unnamed protein product [Rhizophagus irregularis]|nr:unnamed protein product [Rhizophagus irregularis]